MTPNLSVLTYIFVSFSIIYLFSSENGSPIDQSSAGAIIATVVKKRKGGGEATFEMDVGDGNHVNLSDPDAIDNLGSDMKSSARNQLKVLQDQMASLMTRLDEHNC